MKAITDTLESKVLGWCIVLCAAIGVVQITTLRSVGRTDILLSMEWALAVGLPLLTLGVLWITTLVFKKWIYEQRDWHVKAGFPVVVLLLALATVLVLMMFTGFSSWVNGQVPLVPISERGYVMERFWNAGPYFAVVLGGILYVRVARFRASRATKSMRTAQRPVPTFGE